MTVNYPEVMFDLSSTNNYNVRSLQTDFGDGYSEVVPDGINNIVRSGSLVHSLLNNTDSTTLRDFLKQYAGTSTVVIIKDCFEDSTGTQTLNTYIQGWSERYAGNGTLSTFTVTFREAFNT